jgi:hypothetical protein
LPSLGVSLSVQETFLEGDKEVGPGLGGFKGPIIDLGLFPNEEIYSVSLDKGHGEGHVSFIRIEGGNPFIEAKV